MQLKSTNTDNNCIDKYYKAKAAWKEIKNEYDLVLASEEEEEEEEEEEKEEEEEEVENEEEEEDDEKEEEEEEEEEEKEEEEEEEEMSEEDKENCNTAKGILVDELRLKYSGKGFEGIQISDGKEWALVKCENLLQMEWGKKCTIINGNQKYDGTDKWLKKAHLSKLDSHLQLVAKLKEFHASVLTHVTGSENIADDINAMWKVLTYMRKTFTAYEEYTKKVKNKRMLEATGTTKNTVAKKRKTRSRTNRKK